MTADVLRRLESKSHKFLDFGAIIAAL